MLNNVREEMLFIIKLKIYTNVTTLHRFEKINIYILCIYNPSKFRKPCGFTLIPIIPDRLTNLAGIRKEVYRKHRQHLELCWNWLS
jgi:hypothetical protein